MKAIYGIMFHQEKHIICVQTVYRYISQELLGVIYKQQDLENMIANKNVDEVNQNTMVSKLTLTNHWSW